MSLAAITANVKGILSAVSGVANVYDHKKYTNNDAAFKAAFKSGNVINTWMITRESTDAQDRGPNNEFDVHTMVVAGYLTETEADFECCARGLLEFSYERAAGRVRDIWRSALPLLRAGDEGGRRTE